jgi:hypothetical protein
MHSPITKIPFQYYDLNNKSGVCGLWKAAVIKVLVSFIAKLVVFATIELD